jgi:deoxyribodipyrimidine photo-lyase
LIGGEKEALQRLSKLAADHARESSKKSDIRSASSIYGANFSSKISPWLAAGCLSPRRMVEELKVKTNR